MKLRLVDVFLPVGWKIFFFFRIPQYDDMAFNLPRGQAILDKWNDIPAGIDVLITHTPPLGFFYNFHLMTN